MSVYFRLGLGSKVPLKKKPPLKTLPCLGFPLLLDCWAVTFTTAWEGTWRGKNGRSELGQGRRQRARRTRGDLKGTRNECRRHEKNLKELLNGRTKRKTLRKASGMWVGREGRWVKTTANRFTLGLLWSSLWELIVLAKQLWPFCVTRGFPQALTSCYNLSSPFPHLKCYLKNIY